MVLMKCMFLKCTLLVRPLHWSLALLERKYMAPSGSTCAHCYSIIYSFTCRATLFNSLRFGFLFQKQNHNACADLLHLTQHFGVITTLQAFRFLAPLIPWFLHNHRPTGNLAWVICGCWKDSINSTAVKRVVGLEPTESIPLHVSLYLETFGR